MLSRNAFNDVTFRKRILPANKEQNILHIYYTYDSNDSD